MKLADKAGPTRDHPESRTELPQPHQRTATAAWPAPEFPSPVKAWPWRVPWFFKYLHNHPAFGFLISKWL